MNERKINLIPSEMSVPPRVINLIKKINKFSTIGAILLIIMIISAIAIFVYFSLELKKYETNMTRLKNEITTLEKSEQKLILAKDRLGKIAAIQVSESSDKDIIKLQKVLTSFSNASDSAYTEIDIGGGKTEISAYSANSVSMSSILDSIAKLKDYKKIILGSLGYNSKSGYLINLVFSNK